MVKAKAKADRAAARSAALAAEKTAVISPPPDEPSPETVTAETHTALDAPEEPAATVSTPASVDRTELLRSKPIVVGRFMQLMVPILIDVYAASVITPVRVKTLTGLLKAVSFLDADGLKQVLAVRFSTSLDAGLLVLTFHKFVPVASFASSILSSKDHPSLVIGALQLVDLLLVKVPALYKPSFRREGVFHEIGTIAARPVTSSKPKTKDKEKDSSEPTSAESGSVSPAPPISVNSISGLKKLSSLSLEPEDAITLRSRIIQFKHLSSDISHDEDSAFTTLRLIVDRISSQQVTEKELYDVLQELAELFASPHTSVSSFELLQSGVVEGLLQFATDQTRTRTSNNLSYDEADLLL